MEQNKPKGNICDERGEIKDILYNEPVEHITVITSKAGVTRGNHFHKETIQWVYLHSGKIKSLTKKENEDVVSSILEPGDLLKTDKLEQHALQALEDSVFFVFTKGPRGGEDYESDTYRLEEPLKEL
jgi:dTDP-4-dehydrorhamnose 3,5-epimerase-like enzyme